MPNENDNALDTVDKIKAALNEYRPDQVGVIEQMAAERQITPEQLAHTEPWWALITEEAEFSEIVVNNPAVTDQKEKDDEREYALALRKIAARIPH